MFPSQALKNSVHRQMCVELKNGESYNGLCKKCDAWMNICLVDVIRTSADGQKFWKMNECVLRGNSIHGIALEEAALTTPKVRGVGSKEMRKKKGVPVGKGKFASAGGKREGPGGKQKATVGEKDSSRNEGRPGRQTEKQSIGKKRSFSGEKQEGQRKKPPPKRK